MSGLPLSALQKIRTEADMKVNHPRRAVDTALRGWSIVKKGTTGCAGGKKEFHLWMEKENLQ